MESRKKLMGLRSIKTIIAVLISYFIAYFIDGLNPSMMAAASITAMNISISDSFASSLNRVGSNIAAIAMAFILQAFGLVNPLGVALGLTLIIIFCNLLGWKTSIGGAGIFFVFVLQVPYDNNNLEIYAINRIIDTVIGSVIGLLVNAYLFRPRQEKYLLMSYRATYLDLRRALKDLLEMDKSVDEFYIIDDVSRIHMNSIKLRKDMKLRMNESINTVTVSKLNNLFRTALSLIIELNELDDYPVINEKNYDELNYYFKGDFESAFKVGESDKEYDKRYNYELTKLIHTLESIEYNLYEYTKMYQRTKDRWYLEGKE